MATNKDDFLTNTLKAEALLQQVATLNFQQQPRQLIFNNKYIKLFHYQSNITTHKLPLLIVFSTINQPDILDLHPNYSLIKSLLERGQDIYLIEWVRPTLTETDISLDHYVCNDIDTAVNLILKEHQLDKINILGVCQGGLLSLCYAAIHDRVEKLILVTTPIDFDAGEHVITSLVKNINADVFSSNIPGAWVSNFFISLRPFELIGKKYLNLLDKLDNEYYIEQFLLVEKWLQDAPDQSMLAFKQLIQDFYQGNKLIKDEVYLNDHQVRLMNVKADILNIIAGNDDIVPPLSSSALKQHIPTKQYTEEYLASGHIGIYLNKIVSKELVLAITKYLAGNA